MHEIIIRAKRNRGGLGVEPYWMIRNDEGKYLQVVSPGPRGSNFGSEAVIEWTRSRSLASEFHVGSPDQVSLMTVQRDGTVQQSGWVVPAMETARLLIGRFGGRLVTVRPRAHAHAHAVAA